MAPNKGERVKVVDFTGNVEAVNTAEGMIKGVLVQADSYSAYVPMESVVLVEPAYEAGHMYVDASGVFYFRTLIDEWRNTVGTLFGNDFPTRPLTKLVREDGK